VEACAELLRSLPAVGALRRRMGQLTPPEYRTWLGVLATLCAHPDGIRLGQLATELHVDASVASRQFARLESAGLARRERDPQDGRALVLQPTEHGREWLTRTRHVYAASLVEILPGWTDADVTTLADLLTRLRASAAAAPPATTVLALDAPMTDTSGAPA
jgi:DNA-binding MarR family transcriptional regulator